MISCNKNIKILFHIVKIVVKVILQICNVTVIKRAVSKIHKIYVK